MSIQSIALENVSKKFYDRNIFKKVSCTFYTGRSYAITGNSGSGKSTLLNIIIGFIPPTTGQVCFNNRGLSQLARSEYDRIRSHSFGFVSQEAQLLPELTVIENIMLSLLIGGYSFAYAYSQAQELLSLIELDAYAEYYPYQLSGGQQQRVSLARALIKRPAFLCADEPTGNLDAQTAQHIVDLLLTCCSSYGVGLIISSHDIMLMNRMQTIFVLQSGLLVEKDH